jgi:hypothetical protein
LGENPAKSRKRTTTTRSATKERKKDRGKRLITKSGKVSEAQRKSENRLATIKEKRESSLLFAGAIM